jgi:DUF3102 family protein
MPPPNPQKRGPTNSQVGRASSQVFSKQISTTAESLVQDELRGSNSLTVLAEQVRATLAESAAAETVAIDKAIHAGNYLVEAKAACRHGEWLSFLTKAEIQERTAQRYMKLARSGLKSDTVSELGGIKATLRWLRHMELPAIGDALAVDVEPDFRALVWQVEKGFCLLAVNSSEMVFMERPISGEPWIWLALYQALEHRFRDMRFELRRPGVDVPVFARQLWHEVGYLPPEGGAA